MNLIVDKLSFIKEFLTPLSNFNETGLTIIDAEDGKLHAYATASNAHNILYAQYTPEKIDGGIQSLHLKDCKKLINAFAFINDASVDLQYTGKSIKFQNKQIKFECPLLDELIGNKMRPSLPREKINAFEGNVQFAISTDVISSLSKGRAIAPEIDRVVIRKASDELLEIGIEDPSKSAANTFSLMVPWQLISGNINNDNAFFLSTLTSINKINGSLVVQIREQSGVAIFIMQTNNTTLKYIISTIK